MWPMIVVGFNEIHIKNLDPLKLFNEFLFLGKRRREKPINLKEYKF